VLRRVAGDVRYLYRMKPVTDQSERVVPATASAIWRWIEPVENLPRWFPIAQRSELVSGSGRGRIQRMYSEWAGKPVEIDQQVIHYDPPNLLGWKHVRELMNGKPAPQLSVETRVTIRLEPVASGTRVTIVSEHVPGNALKALVIRLVARPRIRRILDQAVGNLAALPA